MTSAREPDVGVDEHEGRPNPTPVVTRIEPLGPRSPRVRITVDDGDPLEVSLEAVEASRLGVGDTLTPRKRHHLLHADADVRVREAALDLLAHRARTGRELARKLRQKGFAPSRIEPCLERLSEHGLLDDDAVAAAFVRDRIRHRPRGKSRLVSELRAKGVEAGVALETVDRVFEDEEVDEAELARQTVEAWLTRQSADVRDALSGESRTPERERARRRLYGFLARRGFRGDVLGEAMELGVELARS